jgi:hypothetical protein
VRGRPHAGADDPAGVLDDREVGRLAVDQRLAQEARADAEDQVVLGFARAEEVARVGEEVAGALMSGQLDLRRLNLRNARVR